MRQKDLRHSIILAFCIPFIVLLASPLIFYFGNHAEYTANLSNTFLFLLLICIVITVLLWVFLLAIARWPSFYAALSGIIVGFALSAWVQSQLFAWDFGLLDGKEIKWSNWSIHANIELVVWFFITNIAIVLAYRSKNILFLVAKSTLLLGLLSIITAWTSSDYKLKDSFSIDTSDFFAFHEKNNKILIVLDSFQSDIFHEIARRWPQEVEFLRGFVFYPNTVGGYPTTAASLPLIMTGKFYKNEIPFHDWRSTHYASGNIADYFAEKGYGVSLVTIVPHLLEGIKAKKANITDFAESIGPMSRQQLLLLDGGLFRIMPILFKPFIYNKGNWAFFNSVKKDKLPQGLNGDDLRFLKIFEKKVKNNSTNKGEFKLYHYAGVHAPSQINEHFEYEKDMPDTRETNLRHARGVLSFLHRKLQKLEQLGLYDSAEILVVGDHGRGFMPEDIHRSSDSIKNEVDHLVLGGARPLFLYKKSGANSPLEYSNRSLHLADAVCIFSNKDTRFSCEGYHLAELDKERRRTFLFYSWDDKYWDKKYLPPMDDYVVYGDVRHVSSWRSSHLQYVKGTVKKSSHYGSYQLGDAVSFIEGGNSNEYLHEGWSTPEVDHLWSDGSKSQLVFHLNQQEHSPLILKLYALGYGTKPQKVDVMVNGHKVANWNMLHLDWYTATIPEKIIKNKILDINFIIANPITPCEVSESQDCRKLGIFAQEMIIEKQKSVS